MPLYEYYNTGENQAVKIFGSTWHAQTFTVGTTGLNIQHNVTSVKLHLYRTGLPGIISVSIRNVDENGFPTGNDIAYGETLGDTLSTAEVSEWREIVFDTSQQALLLPNTTYAIVVRAPDADGTNRSLHWWQDVLIGEQGYVGGAATQSVDSGSSWGGFAPVDMMFEVYGTGLTPEQCAFDNQIDCENAGCYWYDGSCHNVPQGQNGDGIPWLLIGGALAIGVVAVILLTRKKSE